MPTDLLLQGRNVQQLASDGAAWTMDMGTQKRIIEIIENGNITTMYKGFAPYGTPESQPAWRIQRIIMDENNDFELRDEIAGNGEFDQIWDNRAALGYA